MNYFNRRATKAEHLAAAWIKNLNPQRDTFKLPLDYCQDPEVYRAQLQVEAFLAGYQAAQAEPERADG